ncbi:MAG: DUF2283 domain-containing protein [Anaerolineaceae bacterium]|jgi:uncharacterized protein YuzE|nr:MAG: DUF2283 domain-containing protein [Anaerolineaceae bacterium]
MRIKYFEDTDTTLVEFSSNPPVETKELNENIYLDLDAEGNVVSMTIEHAGQSADMREFLYQRIPAGSLA